VSTRVSHPVIAAPAAIAAPTAIAAPATIPVPAVEHAPALRSCLNCGAPLTGRYCSNCSQAADIHVPSTLELIHEALEGLTHSDSRLWRTLYLLWLKPGRLTQEFIAGRRVAYLPPFRLYLVLSVIFFLLASVSHPYGKVVQLDDSDLKGRSPDAACSDLNVSIGGTDWTPRLRHACTVVVSDSGESLMHAVVGTMPKAMFIFLPLVAFLHMLMYWRPWHKYAEHLLFFLHLHAFFFSVMILVMLVAAADSAWPRLDPSKGFVSLVFWSFVLYTVLAMRRVFGRGWAATVFKALALSFVYMIVLSFTLAGVIFYAALQL
jgi:hypothetical protein